MRPILMPVMALGLLGTACTEPSGPTGPLAMNGFAVYVASRANQTIPCDARPIELQGNRTDLRLTGPCRFVRLVGEHNDVNVDLAAGGTFEITGSHNDVVWRQVQVGPPPILIDRGESNAFHHETGR